MTQQRQRGVQLSPEGIKIIEQKLQRRGLRKADFKREAKNIASETTISKFLNGKRVEKNIFSELCFKLDILDWENFIEDDNTNGSMRDPLKESPDFYVSPTSDLYIEREADRQCRKLIEIEGSIIKGIGSKKTGKTSLLRRIKKFATDRGYYVAELDLSKSTHENCNDVTSLFQWFCANIMYELKSQPKQSVEDYWRNQPYGDIGAMETGTNYFRDIILNNSQPLVLFLDNVDYLFQYEKEVYQDFFYWLRYLSEIYKIKEGTHSILRKLRQFIFYSTHEQIVYLEDARSPFNVGESIELEPLSPAEFKNLVKRYEINYSNLEESWNNLFNFIGGQIYLSRKALYTLKNQSKQISIDSLKSLQENYSIYEDYLKSLWQVLLNDPDAKEAYRIILQSQEQPHEKQMYRLHRLGLIKNLQTHEPFCELYRDFFSQNFNLVNNNREVKTNE